jgi:type 1 glutamine amidotransferase
MRMTRREMIAGTIGGLALQSGQIKAQPGHSSKRLLAIGDQHRKDYQHDAVSHALATVERLGRESGAYTTDIRTDIQTLTKHPIEFAEKTVLSKPNYRTLNDYDAVFFYTIGELELDARRKADFLSFLRDDGKGFVGAHSANDTLFSWPEFGEMIGGYFDDHPWDVFDAPVIVEAPDFPAMKAFPRRFTIRDEIYQVKNFSRDKVRVLARLDAEKLNFNNSRVHRKDRDFPVAWAREYGKGRVFYSTFGHSDESWDRNDVQTMYLEAIKWAMGMTKGSAVPGKKGS